MIQFRYLFILVLFLSFFQAKSQINLEDSSVQVIPYWDLVDRYEYSISLQKLKYDDRDTTSKEHVTYDVDISVIDSTTNSYLVKWLYKNFKSSSSNPFTREMRKFSENLAVNIRMDEFGVIQEVENWEEVRTHMWNSIDSLIDKSSESRELVYWLQQMKLQNSSEISIRTSLLHDLMQFHNFHGAAYQLKDTLKGQFVSPNVNDQANPFDTYVTVVLEALDTIRMTYTLRSVQEIDSEQMTESTYKMLEKANKKLGLDFTSRRDFLTITNVIETVSTIQNDGWIVKSTNRKKVLAEGITNLEIRTIQMK